jgi:Ni,Fe-hydrogenase III component G
MITTQWRLEQASHPLQAWAVATNAPEPNRVDITVRPENLLSAVQLMVDLQWGYLATITGLDLGAPPAEGAPGGLEILYHFCSGAAILTLRVLLPYDAAALPSIDRLVPAATIYEREVKEMFGVEFQNMRDPRRLFLPDDWEEGVFPLRKEFQAKETPAG